MPQFDTFSFFSQLFWVFSCFIIFYLTFCFRLLPALSTILKIRKRKLSQNSSSSVSESTLTVDSNSALLAKNAFDNFNSKMNSINSASTSVSTDSNLSTVTTQFAASRNFSSQVFSSAQIVSFLYV